MKRASVNKLNLGLTYVNTTAGFSRAIIELRKNKGRFFSREKIFEKIQLSFKLWSNCPLKIAEIRLKILAIKLSFALTVPPVYNKTQDVFD